jgi:serine/threonine protein kinase
MAAVIALEDVNQRQLLATPAGALLRTATYQDQLLHAEVAGRFSASAALSKTNTMSIDARAPPGEQFGVQFRGQEVRARFVFDLQIAADGVVSATGTTPADTSLVYSSLEFHDVAALNGQPFSFASDFFQSSANGIALNVDDTDEPVYARLKGETAFLESGFQFSGVTVSLKYPGLFNTSTLGASPGVTRSFRLLPASFIRLESYFVELKEGTDDDDIAADDGASAGSSPSQIRGSYLTIVDYEPPSFNGTCPPSSTLRAETGQAFAIASWPEPSPIDNRGILELRSSAAPGTRLAITAVGAAPHSVRYTATDLFGLESVCEFFVYVLDEEPPIVLCPLSVSLMTDPGQPFATLPGALAQARNVSDNSGLPPLQTSPPARQYPVGAHTVVLTYTDTHNNTGTCSFGVTVSDDEPPSFVNCPTIGPSVIAAAGQSSAAVHYDVIRAQDNSGTVNMTATALSGSMFNVGVTQVRVRAADGSGNVALCSFNVTVSSQITLGGAQEQAGADNTPLLAGLLTGAAVILILIATIVIILRRRRSRPHNFAALMSEMAALVQVTSDAEQEASALGENDTDMAVRTPRELKRAQIKTLDRLGKGQFGDVSKGLLSESGRPNYIVAIKTLHEGAGEGERQDLLREALLMAQFMHDNVVGLVGVVTAGLPTMVVIEFCELGSLQDYLLKRPVSEEARVAFALDCASGLAYLATRSYVHRDVAARNVLISSDGRAKVSDFGMSRNTEDADYYYSRSKLPIRWCAPECLENGRFSSSSDVWAYGVLLYEIWTSADLPYKGWSNQKVWVQVVSGYRLPCPKGCQEDVHTVMLRCWAASPSERPAFSALVEFFSQLAPQTQPRPDALSRSRSVEDPTSALSADCVSIALKKRLPHNLPSSQPGAVSSADLDPSKAGTQVEVSARSLAHLNKYTSQRGIASQFPPDGESGARQTGTVSLDSSAQDIEAVRYAARLAAAEYEYAVLSLYDTAESHPGLCTDAQMISSDRGSQLSSPRSPHAGVGLGAPPVSSKIDADAAAAAVDVVHPGPRTYLQPVTSPRRATYESMSDMGDDANRPVRAVPEEHVYSRASLSLAESAIPPATYATASMALEAGAHAAAAARTLADKSLFRDGQRHTPPPHEERLYLEPAPACSDGHSAYSTDADLRSRTERKQGSRTSVGSGHSSGSAGRSSSFV